MAYYMIRAAKLKPKIAAAGFTAEQLTLVHQMMRGCTMLRQGKVITSFLQAMIPDEMEIRYSRELQGKHGAYRIAYVAKKGEVIDSETLELTAVQMEEGEDQ